MFGEDLQPLSNEWAGICLVDEQCPVARDIDAAQTALEHMHKAGIVSAETFSNRKALLSARRYILAAAQQTHGCPRANGSEMQEKANNDPLNCQLPTGRIENFAIGTPDQMTGVVHPGRTERAGFKQ